VIATAVKTISILEEPDLSSRYITRAHDFTIETHLQNTGPMTFDRALWVAQKLEDRYLRSTTVFYHLLPSALTATEKQNDGGRI
jgi:hypothetical protein